MASSNTIDYQGHRGCRGLLPENSIPAFLHALEFPAVRTLEMDVVITGDQQVIISHEPWLSEEICSLPASDELGFILPQVQAVPYPGEPLDSLVSILALDLVQIQKIDCGTKDHPRFPEQHSLATHKPSLAQLLTALEQHKAALSATEQERIDQLFFNIELKYTPEWEAAGLVPDIATFCELVLEAIQPLMQAEMRVSLQCFHPPLLAHFRQLAPEVPLVYLDEFPQEGSLEEKFAALGFVPEVYSPYFEPLTPAEVQKSQELGAKVIPWTVNETAQMQQLVEWGVDGIITDYPNRIPEASE